MRQYTEVRVRELTEHGSWPWRYIVEGLTKERWEKPWPWSRAKAPVAPSWERLRHGTRDYRPLASHDAARLAEHYRTQIGAPNHDHH
jgi:hypothetical protein